MKSHLLRLENISKSFSGVPVLEDVSFDLYPGEVHCIVGQNGAGKSTLIKILSGVHKCDSGQVFIHDELVEIGSPAEGQKHGISVIYQEIDLIPDLTVADNICLGMEETYGGLLRKISFEKKIAKEMLQLLKEKIDPATVVKKLPIAQQQMTAIAKALALKAGIIVMDEPTSALSGKEIETLFRIITDLKSHDIGIIYISHRLSEIFRIGDRVTVLRDGKRVITSKCDETDTSKLIQSMVGKEFGRMFPEKLKLADERVVLEIKDLSLPGKFENISFKLNAGEILGLAGFVGSGRSELAQAIFGRRPSASGDIKVNGKSVNINRTKVAIKNRIGMIPEDRKIQALQVQAPLFENITFNSLNRLKYFGWINRGKQLKMAKDRIKKFNIQPPQPLKLVEELSGGNQQKIVLGNWLFEDADVLIMDDPTRGIDVGAKAEIFRIIRAWAEKGVGIIFISSEFQELVGMCDRILLIREGRQVGILDGSRATEEMILQAILNAESGQENVFMD
ncbi:MAG: sugar ABC transporter ATP-binding protein [Deltaproteobacteria bacterium]|jgi:ribose transport system ATP-binding protein